VVIVGFEVYQYQGTAVDTGRMAMAHVTALIVIPVGKWIGIDGGMAVHIYVVRCVVPVGMRFISHIPRAFRTHVEH